MDKMQTETARRVSTPPEPRDYLWTADTRTAAHKRARDMANLLGMPCAILLGPACWYVRADMGDTLAGLAPKTKRVGLALPDA